jgi:hypothetical protein
MKAVIVATALPRENGEATGPAGLRMLLDRPFLQHVAERLVDHGADEIEVVVCDAPETVRAVLGDGKRWGVSIRYHLARDPQRPMPAVKRAVIHDPDPVLLARADRLWEEDEAHDAGPGVSCLAGPDGAPGVEWAGLASVSPAALLEAPDAIDLEALGEWLVSCATREGILRAARATFGCDTIKGWLSAQRAALDGRLSGLHFGGREVEPGIWLSRNVIVPPSARLEAPVYVGEDCRIEAGAVLGSGTVVGAGSVIARRARLRGALVLPGSYVGESVSLEDVAADHGTLYHGALGVATPVRDRHILDAVAPPARGSRLGRAAVRLASGLALLPLLPLATIALLLRRATGRGGLTRREIVRLPAAADAAGWRTLRLWQAADEDLTWSRAVLRVAAGLLAVLQGRLDLVGVTPRTRQEVEALPPAMRAVYLQGRAGLVTEASVTLDPEASAEERLAADLAYVVSRSAQRDLGILVQATVS